MTALNAAAKAALRAAGVSQAAWARHWFPANAVAGDPSTGIGRPVWLGDACGCPDDRCINHHHDEGDDCGCLATLLDSYDGPGRTAALTAPADAYVADWREQQPRSAGAYRGALRVLVGGQHCGAVIRCESGWIPQVHGYPRTRTLETQSAAEQAVTAVLRSAWARRLGYRKASRVFWSDKARKLAAPKAGAR